MLSVLKDGADIKIDMRKMYKDKEGNLQHTAKGIRFDEDDWRKIVKMITQVNLEIDILKKQPDSVPVFKGGSGNRMQTIKNKSKEIRNKFKTKKEKRRQEK